VEKEEWQKLRFLDFEDESGTIVTWDKLLEKHKLPFEVSKLQPPRRETDLLS
jgi:hypothetical protein